MNNAYDRAGEDATARSRAAEGFQVEDGRLPSIYDLPAKQKYRMCLVVDDGSTRQERAVARLRAELAAETDRLIAAQNEIGQLKVAVSAANERIAGLLANQEWLCDKCNTVYPGPPTAGLDCVICPSCGGTTAPKQTVLLRRDNERIAELRGLYEAATKTKLENPDYD